MTKADIRLYKDILNIMENGTLDENPRPKYKDCLLYTSKVKRERKRTKEKEAENI